MTTFNNRANVLEGPIEERLMGHRDVLVPNCTVTLCYTIQSSFVERRSFFDALQWSSRFLDH